MTYPRHWVSFRAFGLAFAIVLTPALMQTSGTCGVGDTTLETLQFEVDGENLIGAFSPDQRVYEAMLPEGAEVATVIAISSYEKAEIHLISEQACESPQVERFQTGGGELQLEEWGPGHTLVRVFAHPPEGAIDVMGYHIHVMAPTLCE
jgi:hypothetical protein